MTHDIHMIILYIIYMYITVKLDALGYVLIRVVQGRRTWKTWETSGILPACVSALHHSWRPTDKPWVAKTGRGQRRIHGLRVSQPLAV